MHFLNSTNIVKLDKCLQIYVGCFFKLDKYCQIKKKMFIKGGDPRLVAVTFGYQGLIWEYYILKSGNIVVVLRLCLCVTCWCKTTALGIHLSELRQTTRMILLGIYSVSFCVVIVFEYQNP